MTTPHPLVLDDLALVQDLMLTKVLFLTTHQAQDSEWRFERDEIRQLSDHRWEPRNRFLLDYTLGRVVAATVDPADVPPATDPLFDRFLDAVRAADPSAGQIWREMESGAPADDEQSTTSALVSILSGLPERTDGTILANIPPHYAGEDAR